MGVVISLTYLLVTSPAYVLGNELKRFNSASYMYRIQSPELILPICALLVLYTIKTTYLETIEIQKLTYDVYFDLQ